MDEIKSRVLRDEAIQVEVVSLREALDTVRQQRDAAIKVLREVEWVSSRAYCPWCGEGKVNGHAPGCLLATALAVARGDQ